MTTTIEIDFGKVTLTDEVWPDGDAPEHPTAVDVAGQCQSARIHEYVTDMAEMARRTVTVVAPNPHYVDGPALLPEHSPEPTVTTTAVV
jgi:hypothetical protein